jgi:2-polyprenyl-3-methyl-5-hydroxy-6-metoxy-1,4-benzoquinol methylase
MKCNICNTQTASLEDTQLNKVFFHCHTCELIFLDKKFYVSNNDEKNQYDHHNNSLENEGYVKMFNDFLDFTLEGLHVKSVLDFGSGPTPVLAELLKRRGLHVEHFDKFYQPKKVYENKEYDLITSTEVFEHLENPKEVLNLLRNHLTQNGTISIMTLFHTNKQEDFLKWWYRRDPTHITFFTPKTIETMAKECGLKVQKHDNKRIILLSKV